MNTITRADITGKIRTAIDDILPTGFTDTFSDDTLNELWQATIHAVGQLSLELPVHLLDVSVNSGAGTVDASRGSAKLALPNDYLRFVSLDVTGWTGQLAELIEPGSDAEKMQRSAWSRGTATKPKAMIDHAANGARTIVWWPGVSGQTGTLTYVAAPEVVTTATQAVPTVPAVVCAIRAEAEQYIIYRAASIFFEGKKEAVTAEKFRSLSNII